MSGHGARQPDASANPGSAARFYVLLGALAAIPPLAVDVMLPAFADMERDLGLPTGAAAGALSAFLIGFVFGPFLFGPLSDVYGRRPMVLAAMAAFCVGSLLCAAAIDGATLFAARVLQGAGAGAAAALPIAIVRDRFEGDEARRALSLMTFVGGLAPLLAPLAGAGILLAGGWRGIFLWLAVAGLGLLALILRLLPPPSGRDAPGKPTMADFAAILSNKAFLGFSIVNAFNFSAMFAFIAGSPRVFLTDFGMTPVAFGFVFVATSLGLIAGAALNERLLKAGVSSAALLRVSLAGSAGASLALATLAFTGAASVAAFLPLLVINNLCGGIVRPNATHEAMQPARAAAGAASAVLRALQMGLAAAAAAVVAAMSDVQGPLAMSLIMLSTALPALVIGLIVTRRAD